MAVLVFDAFEVVCPSWPSLPSVAAAGHIVPTAPKQVIDTFSVHSLMNNEKTSVLFISRSRSNVCTRHSDALPKTCMYKLLIASPYNLLWRDVRDKPLEHGVQ